MEKMMGGSPSWWSMNSHRPSAGLSPARSSGSVMQEEDRYSFSTTAYNPPRKMEEWKEDDDRQIAYTTMSPDHHTVDLNKGIFGLGAYPALGHGDEQISHRARVSSGSCMMISASSSIMSSGMLDFSASYKNHEMVHDQQQDRPSEVRETVDYRAGGKVKDIPPYEERVEGVEKNGREEPIRDLRNSGLCLVPMAFILHFGGENSNGADYWSPTFGGIYSKLSEDSLKKFIGKCCSEDAVWAPLVIAVLLATGAAILSLKNFEKSFSNTHQRMGLALYALIWVLPVIGFFRPQRGEKLRSIWYTGHWLLRTGTAIIGTMNIFVGLCAYEKKTTKNIRSWTLLFAAQVVIMGFIYLLQDRWDYIKKQGVILGEEQITPSDQIMTSAGSGNQKELPSNMI
ncbi:Transcription factor bHLH133 [Apostasia shenzhenica]|uniref:Transcription factor bHLH133 n=1 Tax=Apostasia shenzhenica TaxID=1088818 RepID=A0A2H9ZZL6_9ASPA|nr:Transcription factor bHLH133 [Apostasia shenzhenica]